MSLLQFVLSAMLLVALGITGKRFKQNAIRRIEALLWSLVWIGSAFIIWQPEIANRLADLVGVGRGVDLVVYGAVILLLFLVFHLHVQHDRLERSLTELVRQEAMRDLEKQKPARLETPKV